MTLRTTCKSRRHGRADPRLLRRGRGAPSPRAGLLPDRVRADEGAADALLAAAAISRFASLLDGLYGGYLRDPRFWPIVERDLRDGQHRSPDADETFFTTAYFHRPEELREEVEESGFEVDAVVGVEGPGWLVAD